MLRYSLAVLLLAAPLAAADFPTASAKAHNWLKSQMAPTGLVDSYKDRSDVCYTYDQAIATVAFVARNDQISAQRVLDALASIQNDDGSWNSAYACKTKASLSNARYVGGVPYSVKGSFSAGFQMSKAEAVASTGWLVIALEGLNPLNLD